ncbi:MAG: hypothetical protein QW540_08845 [Archaeoglobaceae archaeon]
MVEQLIEIKKYEIRYFPGKGHHACRAEIPLFNNIVPKPPIPLGQKPTWVKPDCFAIIRFHDIEQYNPLSLPDCEFLTAVYSPQDIPRGPLYILHYPITLLESIIETLRTEKPVYLQVSFEIPPGKFAYAMITTEKEPVGEEER